MNEYESYAAAGPGESSASPSSAQAPSNGAVSRGAAATSTSLLLSMDDFEDFKQIGKGK